MNKDFKKEDSSALLQEEQQVLALVKRLQQQISFLEKKVDILLSRSEQRTNETKSFSKPFRSFGRSQRQGKARYKGRSRERGSSADHFDRQDDEESRGSEQREKPFYRYDKRRGQSRKPDQGNKPFFHRRRDRS